MNIDGTHFYTYNYHLENFVRYSFMHFKTVNDPPIHKVRTNKTNM